MQENGKKQTKTFQVLVKFSERHCGEKFVNLMDCIVRISKFISWYENVLPMYTIFALAHLLADAIAPVFFFYYLHRHVRPRHKRRRAPKVSKMPVEVCFEGCGVH